MKVSSWNYPKVGNLDGESEDALFFDSDKGMFSVADGASESIFSGVWAKVLTSLYIELSPDLDSEDEIFDFLSQSRDVWLSSIQWDKLRWNVKNKAVHGSYSTFLGVKFEKSDRLICYAVGDSCIFRVRDNQIVSFPISNSAEFGLHPELIWSGYGNPLQRKKNTKVVKLEKTELNCNSGDRIILATDALSKYIMDNGITFVNSLEENFSDKSLFDELRTSGNMKNDDVSGIFIST